MVIESRHDSIDFCFECVEVCLVSVPLGCEVGHPLLQQSYIQNVLIAFEVKILGKREAAECEVVIIIFGIEIFGNYVTDFEFFAAREEGLLIGFKVDCGPIQVALNSLRLQIINPKF